jgi:hypothetical protein
MPFHTQNFAKSLIGRGVAQGFLEQLCSRSKDRVVRRASEMRGERSMEGEQGEQAEITGRDEGAGRE